ncbi:hypothetical protein BX666DRAFT_1934555 [Dichotomocladium elegans]|nr:hypothetical protein BX666DRAFT_1934555 [Dichotomocladium elegans]
MVDMSVIKKQKLCTRCSNPILILLFDGPGSSMSLCPTGTVSDDPKAMTKASISS